jgi:predicted transcriptional regulator YheO
VTGRKAGAKRDDEGAATKAKRGAAAASPGTHRDRRPVLLDQLTGLAELIGSALPSSSEVLLYDLASTPYSIVAMQGNLTGQRVGVPPVGLFPLDPEAGGLISYQKVLEGGRLVRSVTRVVRDEHGAPAAAVSINSDLSAWVRIHDIATDFINGGDLTAADAAGTRVPSGAAADTGPARGEEALDDVDRLAEYLLRRAIQNVGVPVELMKKEHKMRVVEELRDRGIFLMREAAERVAAALDVSRFTVYNYLNSLDEATEDKTAEGQSD